MQKSKETNYVDVDLETLKVSEELQDEENIVVPKIKSFRPTGSGNVPNVKRRDNKKRKNRRKMAKRSRRNNRKNR